MGERVEKWGGGREGEVGTLLARWEVGVWIN